MVARSEGWGRSIRLSKRRNRSCPDLTSFSGPGSERVCKASKRKGGPDGWSFEDVRHLTLEDLEPFADLLNRVESQLELPVQMSTVQVCVLPKSPEKERPMSLTSVWSASSAAAVAQHVDIALLHLIRSEYHKHKTDTVVTLISLDHAEVEQGGNAWASQPYSFP